MGEREYRLCMCVVILMLQVHFCVHVRVHVRVCIDGL